MVHIVLAQIEQPSAHTHSERTDCRFIRNLFYSVVEDPVGLAVMPDYSGNGFEELAALGKNAGTRHVQILDTSSGSQVNRIDFP